jgi:hypothetical protein
MNVLDNKDQIYKMEEREKRKFLGWKLNVNYHFKVVKSLTYHNAYANDFNHRK